MACAIRQANAAFLRRGSTAKPLRKLGPLALHQLTFDRHRQRALAPNEHDWALVARNAGMNQIPVEHHVMLRKDGNHDHWVFLRLR